MKNSNYITREGYLALDHELKYLWREERPKVTQMVADAAAMGDRSENAEYIYGKRRLREIDRRVRFLSKRLDSLTIVDYDPRQEGKIFFGAWVKIEDDVGNIQTLRIVGSDEFDPKKGWISINSPVARALIGHKVDDEITVITPNGKTFYYIIEISYNA
ncbi:transcription elongation factor GreB [Orbaceae bacterium ESL0721]|nr:transcription elongation factor GreB [Orbaceae bacterium ESL0721]